MSAHRFDPTEAEANAWEEFRNHMHRDGFIAILRAAESSALERAAQECDDHAEYFAANRIRALIPPAAAPAAQEDPDNAQAKSTDQGASRVVGVGEHDRAQGEAVAEVEAAKVAAAPAADYDPITAPIPAGDMNGPHGPLPAITYVNAEQWAAAGQQPLDDKKLREPGCKCHQEEGDSPCPVHGGDDAYGEDGASQPEPTT